MYNTTVKKRMKISRMIKMHANQMEEITEAGPGEIFAIFGVDCATGDTLCEGDMTYPVTQQLITLSRRQKAHDSYILLCIYRLDATVCSCPLPS